MSSSLDYPHTSSGDVDWDTLGKMLCAHTLGEVLNASYVDQSYGQADKDLIPDTDWQFVYKDADVVAFQKTFEDSSINAFMGRGVIDLPMEVIIRYLELYERRKEWDRYMVEMKQVKRLSETDVILYMHMSATKCLIKQERDFLHFERITYVGDKYVRSTVSIVHPEFPPKPHIIRAEILPGSGWVLEPFRGSKSQTLVSFLGHVNLKALPSMIVNRVMRRQPMAIHRIRKILMSSSGRHLSVSMSLQREWSEESLTPSEKKAVLEATTEYYQETRRQYIEEVSIDEFTGIRSTRSRVHTVLPICLNPHLAESLAEADNKSMLLRYKPPSSASTCLNSSDLGKGKLPTQRNEVGCVTNGNGSISKTFFNPNRAESRVLSRHPNEPYELVALRGEASTCAAGGHMLWHPVTDMDSNLDRKSKFLLELDLNSDHMIEENTGLKGDSNLPFFTPQGSISSDQFVQGEDSVSDADSEDERSISLPLLTLQSRSVDHHILQQKCRSCSAKLLSN